MYKKCPNCVKQHTDCFAHSEGRCGVLSNTDFKDKDCPFYKTKAQTEEENRKRRERLDAYGLTHLVEKYGR